jgi:hypothetical protein
MATSTSGLVRRSMDKPDEVRPFENNSGELQVVDLGDAGGIVGRAIFKPGWKWSKDVKPIAKTESCQGAHAGYMISGRMRIRMDNGAEEEFGPGDVMIAKPGHDAWVVGNDDCVVIDWQGFGDYAKRH